MILSQSLFIYDEYIFEEEFAFILKKKENLG